MQSLTNVFLKYTCDFDMANDHKHNEASISCEIFFTNTYMVDKGRRIINNVALFCLILRKMNLCNQVGIFLPSNPCPKQAAGKKACLIYVFNIYYFVGFTKAKCNNEY